MRPAEVRPRGGVRGNIERVRVYIQTAAAWLTGQHKVKAGSGEMFRFRAAVPGHSPVEKDSDVPP